MLLFLAMAIRLVPMNAAADTPRHVVSRATSHISIDGVLDEPDWVQAAPISEIRQRVPKPGIAATEKTEVRLLYDNQNFYIGVMCYDSEPDKIIGTQMARDALLEVDDQIEILLDPFHDKRNAFYFATNPLGALLDGLIIEGGRVNTDWDAIWTVKTRRFDQGWSAEFEIPFKSLSFNKGQTVWGFNFARHIKRKIEEDRWAAARLDIRFVQVSEAGDIEGFSDIAQGRGLDIRPYFAPKWTRDAETGHNADTGKFGGDIFYNLTPNLKLTTTINTDFAETEVDNRQINLTRFSLFFPEKRAFFLENAGAFNFGNSSGGRLPDVIPFFSRTIGLLDEKEVPILAGTKLTGKVGRYDVGLLGVRTRATGLTEAKNFFVGRVKRNLFKQSYIGGMFTEGNPASASSSRTIGGDLHLATAKFLGTEQNFSLDVYGLRTSTKGTKGDDSFYGFTATYPNDRWFGRIEWKHIGEDFHPALGFVARSNVNKLDLRAEFNPRPKNFLNVRQMFHEFNFTQYTRLDKGEVESWRIFTAPINYELNSGEHLEFNYIPQFERLFESFEITPGLRLPKGDYRFNRFRLEVNTAAKRRWQVDEAWWFGGFYSGHSEEFETGLSYKVAPHFQIRLGLDQTFARLKEGTFVTRIVEMRTNYSFTPFLTVSNLVQFDNESRNLGWQSRVRWILRPGNELFVVFNQGWLQNERGGFNFKATGTRVAGKIQYTFRF